MQKLDEGLTKSRRQTKRDATLLINILSNCTEDNRLIGRSLLGASVALIKDAM